MKTPARLTTRAVLFHRRPEGDLRRDHLRVGEIELPELEQGHALVSNDYMSLDPNARGRMGTSDMVYTDNFRLGHPLDGWAIGTVLESRSPKLPVGSTVRHRMGYRELAVVSDHAARTVDISLAPAPSWLSALGQTGFAAYVGMRRVGPVRPGDTVFISAAAGGVGLIAGQVARQLGAEQVIGSAGGAEKCRWLTSSAGYDVAIDYRAEHMRDRLSEDAPDGIDLYFDNVGGEQLIAAVNNMTTNGRVVLCGMISSVVGNAPQPSTAQLIDVILRRLTVRGFIVRDHEALRTQFETEVSGWLASGDLTDHYTVTTGIEAASGALVGMLSGANTGKALVRLSDVS